MVADSGLIHLPDGDVYSFTLHGVGKNEAGYEELETTLDQAIATFGDFLISQTS